MTCLISMSCSPSSKTTDHIRTLMFQNQNGSIQCRSSPMTYRMFDNSNRNGGSVSMPTPRWQDYSGIAIISAPEDASMETSVLKYFAKKASLLGLTSLRYRSYLGANQSDIGAYRSDISACRSNIGALDRYQPEQDRSRLSGLAGVSCCCEAHG